MSEEQYSWKELFGEMLPKACGRSTGLEKKTNELSWSSCSEKIVLEDSGCNLQICNASALFLFVLRYELWRNCLDNLKKLRRLARRCDFFVASERGDDLVLVCELTKLQSLDSLEKPIRSGETTTIGERKEEQFIHTLETLQKSSKLWTRVQNAATKVCLLVCQLSQANEDSLYNNISTAFEAPLRNEAVESLGVGVAYPFPEIEPWGFTYRRLSTLAEHTAEVDLTKMLRYGAEEDLALT